MDISHTAAMRHGHMFSWREFTERFPLSSSAMLLCTVLLTCAPKSCAIASPITVEANELIPDGSFEACGSYTSAFTYFSNPGVSNPNCPWSGSGIWIHTGNGAWGGLGAADAVTYVGLQQSMTLSQTLTNLVSGAQYQLKWFQANRPGFGASNLQVTANNGLVYSNPSITTASFVVATSSSWLQPSGTSSSAISFTISSNVRRHSVVRLRDRVTACSVPTASSVTACSVPTAQGKSGLTSICQAEREAFELNIRYPGAAGVC